MVHYHGIVTMPLGGTMKHENGVEAPLARVAEPPVPRRQVQAGRTAGDDSGQDRLKPNATKISTMLRSPAGRTAMNSPCYVTAPDKIGLN
jgi:hypothetical protein